MRWLLLVLVNLSLLDTRLARGDVFDKHTLDVLQAHGEANEPVAALDMAAAKALKPLSKTVTEPTILIRTDEGNWTKAVVSWGFRRGGEGLIPVLLIERYVTYRKDSFSTAVASGKDVMLFTGFHFNFDIGQVVPDGQGGDLTFTSDKRIEPLDTARLWGLDGSLVAETAPARPDPGDREGVFPTDFAGAWIVDVDGRWKGLWNIEVADNGRITGTFTSADTQSTYDLSGRVAAPPHHARLTVAFDNAEMRIDAYLWTKDKSALAGHCSLAGQEFGFFAVRQTPDEAAARPE